MGILFVAVIVLIFGVAILAMATPGTQDNPFITVSYLENYFKLQIPVLSTKNNFMIEEVYLPSGFFLYVF